MTTRAEIAAEQLGAYAGLHASFHARVGGAMGAMHEAWAREQTQAQELRIVPVSLQAPVVGNNVLFSSTELGPKTGYVWAVQSINIAGLLAADAATQLAVYVGQPQPQNLRGTVTGTTPTLNPGRTDMVLNYGDFLTVANLAALSTESVLTLNLVTAVMQTHVLPSYLM
jgi:hypothetical protein